MGRTENNPQAVSMQPTFSASVCTACQMLRKLNLKTVVLEAGELLSGKY